MIVEVLQELGVQISSVGDREIKAHCPVHHLATGRADSKPSWYMNSESGAWLCFSCGQRGGLPQLIDLLDADPDMLGRIPVEIMKRKTSKWDGEEAPEQHERVVVDQDTFDESPRPPVKICDIRDIDYDDVVRFNLRWSKGGKCWLIPIYAIDGTLLGWQEKSRGYFNNVPKDMKKEEALFGYHQVRGDTAMLVESPLDVARLSSYGLPAVASFGAFVSHQQVMALVRRFSTVVLALDNDRAGADGSLFVMQKINDAGVGTIIKFFHYGDSPAKDPGEMDPTSLMAGFDQSSTMMPKEIRRAQERHNTKSRDPGRSQGSRRRRQKRSVW